MFGINSTSDPSISLASCLTYWAFRCRDKNRSPAMGIKTWEYLQSSIQNAAIPSRGIDDYLQNLSKKLIVLCLRPKDLGWIVRPNRVIVRASVTDDGLNFGDVTQLQQDPLLESVAVAGWEELLNSLKPAGIDERNILRVCKTKPTIVATHVRVRFEEDRALGKAESEDDLSIEVHHESI
jgi:hypothetical protein